VVWNIIKRSQTHRVNCRFHIAMTGNHHHRISGLIFLLLIPQHHPFWHFDVAQNQIVIVVLFFETCNTIFGFFNLISIIFFRVFFVVLFELQLRLLWLVFYIILIICFNQLIRFIFNRLNVNNQ
jgi:hypothetical protein